MGLINQPIKYEVEYYSVFSLPIRLIFMRKTTAGIITNEITKTLNIIVQFIPIINPDTILFSVFYALNLIWNPGKCKLKLIGNYEFVLMYALG